MGQDTFERVVGRYTPSGSPAWDPTLEDRSVPFHRSTPSDEMELGARPRQGELAGVSPLGVTKAVRLDISAGNAPLTVVSTKVTNPPISNSTVTRPSVTEEQGDVLSMSVRQGQLR